jgi:hypothetical protein
MPFCTSCGAPRPEGGRFCKRCGAPFLAPRLPAPVAGPAAGIPPASAQPPASVPPAQPAAAATRREVPQEADQKILVQGRPGSSGSVASSTSPATPRVRRAVRLLVVVSLVGGMCAGGYLRYTSTTCQLRRAFAVADWTCG